MEVVVFWRLLYYSNCCIMLRTPMYRWSNSMVTILILNNCRKIKCFRLIFYTSVPNTLPFCVLYEFLNLSHYCGVCDDLNKLVIFTVKSGIDLKYQLANGFVLRVIGETEHDRSEKQDYVVPGHQPRRRNQRHASGIRRCRVPPCTSVPPCTVYVRVP